MRIIATLSMILILSACAGGGTEPAPQPPAPTITDTPTRTVDELLDSFATAAAPTIINPTSLFVATDGTVDPNLALTDLPTPTPRVTTLFELPVGAPGTLIASETQDPDGPQVFERVTLVISGGIKINGQTPPPTTIEITRDGRIVKNNSSQGMVDQATIDHINMLMNEMNFYGAQGNYVGSFGADDEVYYYQITIVSTGARERTINAHEGFMPVELQRLIGRVQVEGAKLQ